jgi:hypothetical protein
LEENHEKAYRSGLHQLRNSSSVVACASDLVFAHHLVNRGHLLRAEPYSQRAQRFVELLACVGSGNGNDLVVPMP